jgi:hypothetical protein
MGRPSTCSTRTSAENPAGGGAQTGDRRVKGRTRTREGALRQPERCRRPSAALLSGAAVLCALAVGFACAEGAPQRSEPYHRTAPVKGANELLGSDSCMECHGHQPAARHHLDCESCHGSGQRHVRNVMAPSGVRFPANGDCLACHETGHRGLLAWELSEHQRAGVLCSDCHNPHNGEPRHLRLASDLTRNVFPHAGVGTTLCVGCLHGLSCSPRGARDPAGREDRRVHPMPPGPVRPLALRAHTGRRRLRLLPCGPRRECDAPAERDPARCLRVLPYGGGNGRHP